MSNFGTAFFYEMINNLNFKHFRHLFLIIWLQHYLSQLTTGYGQRIRLRNIERFRSITLTVQTYPVKDPKCQVYSDFL